MPRPFYGPPTPCAAPECWRPARANGMCNTHNMRRVRGLPLDAPIGIRHRLPVRDRLMRHVDTSGDCWLWTAYCDDKGYGWTTFGLERRTTAAHRAVYEAFVGPIPEGLHIDHLCRTPRCVNPAHLEPVTQAENNRRAAAARRVA